MGIENIMENQEQHNYEKIRKKVKEMKGFYIHLTVFIVINTFILVNLAIRDFYNDENFWKPESFFTLFIWGIGLCLHGFNVFEHPYFLGKKWEERKIKKMMDRDGRSKKNH